MKKKKKTNWFKSFLALLILTIIIFSSYEVKKGYDMYKTAVDKMPIEKKVASIKQIKYYTDFDNIPKDYKNAVLAIEDHRFYNHGPIDIISIGRSVITDLKYMAPVEGGSTLTQQLSKNMYFSQEKKLSRKIAEIFVASKLEKMFSKNEILELYINYSYFGDGYTGIGQASRGYFSKIPMQLSLNEQTLLAGLPNAPSVYALNSNPDLAQKRQDAVIDAMSKYNYLTDNQVKILKEN